ncbi:MAG: hypothetical protein RLZ70_315 [Verrucomicrobiota bacterium]
MAVLLSSALPFRFLTQTFGFLEKRSLPQLLKKAFRSFCSLWKKD